LFETGSELTWTGVTVVHWINFLRIEISLSSVKSPISLTSDSKYDKKELKKDKYSGVTTRGLKMDFGFESFGMGFMPSG